MSVLELTKSNFESTVANNDSLVVVDFWAKWCGPCLAFAPVFEGVSLKHPDCVFAKLDIEAEPEIAQDFNVRSIPFIVIFRGNFIVFAEPGSQTAQSLNQLVQEAKMLNVEDLKKQVP